MAGEFEAGDGSRGNALSTQAGATQAIPVHLREGKGAVKIFDAIYHNVYKDSAEMLGSWKTASHVERTGTSARKPAPPVVAAPASVSSPLPAALNVMPTNGTSHDAPSPNATPSNGASTTANRTAPASALQAL